MEFSLETMQAYLVQYIHALNFLLFIIIF